MFNRALVAFVMLAGTAYAQSEPFDVKVEDVVLRDGLIRIAFSAKNLTAKTESVFVTCTVFAGDRPRGTVTGLIKNVRPGEKAFEEAATRPEKGVDGATCRFSSISRVKL